MGKTQDFRLKTKDLRPKKCRLSILINDRFCHRVHREHRDIKSIINHGLTRINPDEVAHDPDGIAYDASHPDEVVNDTPHGAGRADAPHGASTDFFRPVGCL